MKISVLPRDYRFKGILGQKTLGTGGKQSNHCTIQTVHGVNGDFQAVNTSPDSDIDKWALQLYNLLMVTDIRLLHIIGEDIPGRGFEFGNFISPVCPAPKGEPSVFVCANRPQSVFSGQLGFVSVKQAD
jgi:hypothetical protein